MSLADSPAESSSDDSQPSSQVTFSSLGGDTGAEGRNPFACHYLSCSGFSLLSAGDYAKHKRDWHSGPYQCAECKAKFAAVFPLRRHARASGHKAKWVCQVHGCLFGGSECELKQDYNLHCNMHGFEVLDEEEANPDRDDIDQEPFDMTESQNDLHPADGSSSQVTPTPITTREEDWVCREPCCKFFGRDYVCRSEFKRHADTSTHISASIINEKLVQQMDSSEELKAEQEAMRELRCNTAECPLYDQKFPTPTAFFAHLSTVQHRSCRREIDVGDVVELVATVLKEKNGIPVTSIPQPDTPGIEDGSQCTLRGCPGYNKEFANRGTFKQHCKSLGHIRALTAGDGQTPADMFPGNEMPKTPMTPDNGSTACFSPLRLAPIPVDFRPDSPTLQRASIKASNRAQKTAPKAKIDAAIRTELDALRVEIGSRLQKLDDKLEEKLDTIIRMMANMGVERGKKQADSA